MNNTINNQLSDFFSGFSPRTYKKGQIIIWANDDPPGIIYLKSGEVGQYDISREGHKVILNIFKPYAFFPMNWALNGSQNRYFFEALSKVECIVAPPEQVVEFLKSNPPIVLDLLSRVYRGTDGLLERLAELMAGNSRSKLILELLISAYRFGKVNGDGSAELRIKTTDLSQRTGMARETVSRELKKLEEDNLISRDKDLIVLLDVSRLE